VLFLFFGTYHLINARYKVKQKNKKILIKWEPDYRERFLKKQFGLLLV
jgi:hypothetical protein